MSQADQGVAELLLDNTYFGGWKKVRVTRSIEQMAGAFELDMADRWPGQVRAVPVRPGKACQVFLDSHPVINGFIDSPSPEFDSGRHSITAAGRDKTADLVDCSAIYKSGQWHGARLDRIARDLIAPFNIKLIVDTDVGAAFGSYNIQEGETVFECLERAARTRALLLTSNALGDLVITRAGKNKAVDTLVEGVNIKAGRGDFSHKDRFSKYIVKGQGKLGSDGDEEYAAPSASVEDPAITRYRPLIVLSENHGSSKSLKDRAEWERMIRYGRSVRGTLTVQGWTQSNGALWEPNTLTTVTTPSLFLPEPTELLIVGCIYSLDNDGGTLTELAVTLPEAFEMLEGVGASKLFGKLKTKDQRDKKRKSGDDDWSML